MSTRRNTMGHGLLLATVALAATVAVAACKSSDGSSNTSTVAAAAAGDVVRYPTGEVVDTGTFTVRTTVRAHKAADVNSAGVEVLQPGSTVSRVVRYGAFSLVQWGTMNGMKQAWVETSQMLRPIYYDAGVGSTPFGQTNFGNQGQPPTGAVPTAPATTVAPPPATTAPPATTTAAKTAPPAKRAPPAATIRTIAPPVKVK